MYANYLVDLGKLVYLVSSPSDAMSFKKVFDSPDSKYHRHYPEPRSSSSVWRRCHQVLTAR